MANKKDERSVVPFPGKKYADKKGIAFGSTIKDYRIRAQMDQEQVGRACGLTGNTVSNWERGVSRPDLKLIPLLCDLLGIPLEVFFGMPSASTLSGTERHIIEDYRRMTTPNKAQLVKVIDAIMESQEETRKDGYRKNYIHLLGHDSGLAAGFGAPLDEEPDTFPIFVRISRDAMRSDDIFPVNGESMEPTFPDGSMVFVERTTPDELSYGDTVACIVAGTPYVKIYEKDGLHSINPKYKPMHISDDDNMRLIGRVVGLVPEEDLASEAETAELLEVFVDELN